MLISAFFPVRALAPRFRPRRRISACSIPRTRLSEAFATVGQPGEALEAYRFLQHTEALGRLAVGGEDRLILDVLMGKTLTQARTSPDGVAGAVRESAERIQVGGIFVRKRGG